MLITVQTGLCICLRRPPEKADVRNRKDIRTVVCTVCEIYIKKFLSGKMACMVL